jgi:hypothetical protein
LSDYLKTKLNWSGDERKKNKISAKIKRKSRCHHCYNVIYSCNGVTSPKVFFHGYSLTITISISSNCDIRVVARGPAVRVLGQTEPIPVDLGSVVLDIPCFLLGVYMD